MPQPPEPTIAAIATPAGSGGIGVLRISGSHALALLKQLFRPKRQVEDFASHHLYYGWIIAPTTGRPLDEVLAVYMRAPATYTREDVVEIHCHGSYLILEAILHEVLAAGARLAEPGEFTKRAFLNGRIDLTQAEAVTDLLQARTREGLNLALAQLQGGLHQRLLAIREALLTARAILEVAIDFPEEEVEILTPAAMLDSLHRQVELPLQELLSAADRGKIYREGISVIIVGQPNVGKSSLLNSLLREERAIVTATPGTTRDTIEEYIKIKGMPVRIIDTAGIREVREVVEEMGIRRAREKMTAADLILLLLDSSKPPEAADRQLYESADPQKVILVANKADIGRPEIWGECRQNFPGQTLVAISATTGAGLPELEEIIFQKVAGKSDWDPGCGCAPNVRQQISLEQALLATRQVGAGLAADLPPDLVVIDLQTALDHLGEIVGETTSEDVLDTIFGSFCLGK